MARHRAGAGSAWRHRGGKSGGVSTAAKHGGAGKRNKKIKISVT